MTNNQSKNSKPTMKPLVTCQRVLTWVSVFPVEKNTTKRKRLLFKILPMLLLISNIIGVISSSLFCWKYIKIDLEGSLYALFQVAGMLGMSNIIIVSFISRKKVPKIFENLSQIYKSCKKSIINFHCFKK